MYQIKLSSFFPGWPLERQTPGGRGVWGNCNFHINSPVDACDYWVVYDNLVHPETVSCPRQNTILITGEPPGLRFYPQAFLRQFWLVITCHRGLKHPNVWNYQSSLPWHVGRKTRNHENLGFSKSYDELSGLRSIDKNRLISVIASDLQYSEGHRKRLEFARQLKSYFGERLDHFGRGVCEIEDKWDAIASYRYHIVLENSACPDYWTEKLADAYLGGAFPFYYGAPNLASYFSPKSFLPIDLNFEASVEKIEGAIAAGQYEKSLVEIWRARDRVLNQYNLFAFIASYVNGQPPSKERSRVTVRPRGCFQPTLADRLVRRAKHILEKARKVAKQL